MNRRISGLIVAAQILLATDAKSFANDPGGGTNSVGANVTLTDNGSSVTLANGVVTATINKDSGKITSLIYRGYETVQPGGNIYYSMDGTPEYREMSGCIYAIKTNTADMVDVSFRQNWSSQNQAFDIEAHWVLRRGDSGCYAYAILDHPASYPTTTVSEWRMVWKLPGDLLERVYVDDLRHWQQPSIADINAAEATGISEIVKLTTGVRAGHYDSKYQYAAEYENIGCWGHASNVKNFGTWIVTGNYEYFNDGPTKQDLTTDWEYQLIHFGRNHYSPSGANDTHGTSGVAWRKIYGPFLLYLNYDPTGGDACWTDARAQVEAEHGAWPYSWLTGNSDYPLADARGAVSGRFLATDPLKSSVSTSNAWVGLTDLAADWQFDSDHYQYWMHAAADGSFSIQNVRPGTYTLHAFTEGEMGEYALSNVVVSVAATNALGDLTWNVPRTGNFLLWEIGVPDRTAKEFRHGTSNYYEGYIWDTFASEFPNPLEYTVGVSDWSKDLNYVHNSYKVNGVRNQWKWRLNFFMLTVPPSGNATFNIAFASANSAALNLYVNNESSPFTSFTPPSPPVGGNALQREGIHAKYYVRQVTIPVSNLHVGTNTITLVMTSTGSDGNHFMYDALSLELPSKPPLPAGFDLSWTGGLASNTWDLATTANWSSNATARVFSNGNRVLFDDTGLNTPSITLTGSLQPAAVTVYAAESFTFTGSGFLTGAMTLAKNGAGALTVENTNTYAGTTTVSNGTLRVNGTLNQSPVTVRGGGSVTGTGRLGAGLTMLSGASLAPGSSPGTLIVSNLLTELGGVTNHFELSADPASSVSNDLIKVFGNVSLSGTNTIFVHPLNTLLSPGVYPLIQYSGNLTGSVANLKVSGAVGRPSVFTNPPGLIALLVISNRPPTNVLWVGGLAGNTWDESPTSNWLNGASSDVFSYGDSAIFDNTGSTSPALNLVGDLFAGSVSVNASIAYTFTGFGNITGTSSLSKSGAGTLTILNTNDFSGPTTVNGGTLAIASLGNSGSPGAIGAANAASSNLVIQSAASLRFLGANSTSDHGATIGTGGGSIDVTNPIVNLTLAGDVTGVGALTKTGPGSLTLSGNNSYSGGTIISAGTLQMGAGADTGTLGSGDVTNNAVLAFNRSDDVTFEPVIRGSGIVVKKGGGTITLVSSNSYSGGTTNAAGILLLSNNAALGTGPLVFASPTGSAVQLANGVTVTNSWIIVATNTTDTMMDCPVGNGTWAGNVTLGTSASFRPGTSGSGTLFFKGTANIGGANFIVPRGNVTIAGSGVVSAGGTVCAIGRSSSGSGTTFTARDNASLTFSSGFMMGHISSSTPYPIICTIQDNAVLSTVTANLNLHNATNSGATTVLNLNGGTLLTGGFIKSQTSAAQTATINFNGGTVKAATANASFLNAFTGLTANVSTNGAKIDDGGLAISIGQPLIHSAVLGAVADGGLTKVGVGTLTLTATNSYTGPMTIAAGTLALTGSAVIASSSSIIVAAGAIFDASGRTGGGMSLAGGQTLSGFGSVKGNFVVGSGARLAPGVAQGGIGALTFSNALTLAAGGTNIFEISKSPLTNDAVRVFGALTNGGALVVTNIAGSLATGDSFKLFNAASYAGTFGAVTLPPLGTGLAWNTNALNTNGTISVVTVASPVFNAIQVLNGNLVCSGGGGSANGTYYVLTSTNLSLALPSWTRSATNSFDANGNFIFTNGISVDVPQTFFRLALP